IAFFYTSEYTGFLLAWLIFFTLPAVTRARQHIRVTFLVDLLRPRLRGALAAFSDVLCLIYYGALIALAAQLTLVSWTDHIRSQGILLTWLFYPQLGMVLGLGLMWLVPLVAALTSVLQPKVAAREAERASVEAP